jgi:hypothetical protein
LGPPGDIIDDRIANVVGNPALVRVPQDLFWLDRFLHQFGDDLVLARELPPQRGDGPQIVGLGRSILALEDRRAVLEKQLLPGVNQGGLKLVLVAEIRDRQEVDQGAPEDGDLFRGRVILAGLSLRRNSYRVVVELGRGDSPFPAEARQPDLSP